MVQTIPVNQTSLRMIYFWSHIQTDVLSNTPNNLLIVIQYPGRLQNMSDTWYLARYYNARGSV